MMKKILPSLCLLFSLTLMSSLYAECKCKHSHLGVNNNPQLEEQQASLEIDDDNLDEMENI